MEFRTLSRLESRVVLSLESERAEMLALDDIQRRVGVSRGHARKLAHQLARKGWIQRLGGGRYLLNPARYGPDALSDTDALRIGRGIVRPYYFSHLTAASLHGFATQMSRVYTVGTPGRGGRKSVGPIEFQLVHLGTGRFFGGIRRTVRGVAVRLTDAEKTVLDCLDRPGLCGGLPTVVQVLHRAKPNLDYLRLLRHVIRFPNRCLVPRLGYLLEQVRPELPRPRWVGDRLRGLLPSGNVCLGSPAVYGVQGRTDHDWKLIVNVPRIQLLGEVEVR